MRPKYTVPSESGRKGCASVSSGVITLVFSERLGCVINSPTLYSVGFQVRISSKRRTKLISGFVHFFSLRIVLNISFIS
jgi:hypothetical protein